MKTNNNQDIKKVSQIREMLISDISQVVDIHLKSFPGFFLSFLGKDFLSLYYQTIVQSPFGIGLVSEEKGEISGFVTGIANPQKFYSEYIKKNWLKLMLISLKAILKNPKSIYKLFKGLFFSKKSPGSEKIVNLSSIGVAPEFQGRGIGSSLVKALILAVADRGAEKIFLGVKKTELDTIAFYKKFGFKINDTIENPGFGDSIILCKEFQNDKK